MLIERELSALVVTNPGQMAAQQPGCDRRTFLGECGHVAVHRRIEVELPRFVELRDGVRGQRLRHAADAKLRLWRRGTLRFEIRVSKGFRPHDLPVHRDRHSESGNVGGELLAGDGARSRSHRGPAWIDGGQRGRLGNTGCLHKSDERQHALTPFEERIRYPPMSDSRTSELRGKAEVLRQLHVEGPMLVLPNAWDAGSARIFIEAGFKALATTSAGIAFSLGYPDGERISRDEMLAAVARITRRIDVPITADMEAGYGMPPKAVAETVRRVIDAGAVGMNLEDRMEGKRLIDFPLAVERVGAARAAADAAGIPFVLNARTDAFEAPADSVFVPFVGDHGTIEQLVQLIRAPLNILGTPNAPSLKEMAALGVRRVTFGSAPMRATL